MKTAPFQSHLVVEAVMGMGEGGGGEGGGVIHEINKLLGQAYWLLGFSWILVEKICFSCFWNIDPPILHPY